MGRKPQRTEALILPHHRSLVPDASLPPIKHPSCCLFRRSLTSNLASPTLPKRSISCAGARRPAQRWTGAYLTPTERSRTARCSQSCIQYHLQPARRLSPLSHCHCDSLSCPCRAFLFVSTRKPVTEYVKPLFRRPIDRLTDHDATMPPPSVAQQKALIAQFVTLTGASERHATRVSG